MKEEARKVGGVPELEAEIKKKSKLVAMLAPCFVAQYDYPEIITQLKDLGFDKVVELTFAAKIVNHEYHKLLKKNNGKSLLISTVCPGSVATIKSQFPEFEKNLIRVYSPMIVMGKICKKEYPKHKCVFVSPCNFKKQEAETTEDVDIAIGMDELQTLFDKYKIKPRKVKPEPKFDMFYNEYTKIYPLAGGLSKTAHIKQLLKEGESMNIDGIARVIEFLKHPDKKVKFLDANFCVGGCIGGPLLTQSRSLEEKKKRVLAYVEKAVHETIPKGEKGVLAKAKGIKVTF
jgi:iron only hydrogenase large subunit-like protein